VAKNRNLSVNIMTIKG